MRTRPRLETSFLANRAGANALTRDGRYSATSRSICLVISVDMLEVKVDETWRFISNAIDSEALSEIVSVSVSIRLVRTR